MKDIKQNETASIDATRQIMVSVCCLVYNHEPFLRVCFDGFVMQKTTFPIEILVHDDASTDHSVDIIREYTAKYPDLFKPIYQAENQYSKGVDVFSLNARRAQGKYIAVCEGDDYWTDPMKLQKQVEFLEEHMDYSMCFHRAKILLEGRHGVGLNCFDINDREYTATELFEEWKVATASIVCRRDALKYEIKGESRILNGDIFLVEKCAHIGKVRGMSFVASVYRVNDNGMTYSKILHDIRIEKYPQHFECIKDNFPLINSSVVEKEIVQSYYNRALATTDDSKRMADFNIIEKYCPGFIKEEKRKNRKAKVKRMIKKLLFMKC